MADREIIIRLMADTTQAEANLRTVETEIRKLTKALSDGTISADKYQKEMGQLSRSAGELKQEIKELEAETKKNAASSDRASSSGDRLIGMVGRFASTAVIGAAIKSTIGWADGIKDLSENTGISIQRLQQFERVANTSGTTLGAVTNAALDLSKRLGEGEKSTIAAVEKLGLNLDRLKQQDPGDRLIAVAEAVSRVANDADRAALKTALLGKNSKELDSALRTIASGGLDEMTTASDETIDAMALLSDRWENAKQTAKSWGAELLVQIPIIGGYTAQVERLKRGLEGTFGIAFNAGALPSVARPNLNLATPASAPGVNAIQLATGPATWENLEKSLKDEIEANKRLIKATDAAAKAVMELPAWMQFEFEKRLAAASRDITAIRDSVGQFLIRQATALIPSSPLPGGGMTSLYGGGLTGTSPGGVGGVGFMGRLGSGFASIAPQAIQGLFSGGNAGQVLGGLGGGALGAALSSTITTAVGGTLGATLGSIVPVLGTILGGLAGKLFGNLFGPSRSARLDQQATGQIHQTQAGLLQQYGSLDNIRTLGNQVGVDLAGAWGDRSRAGLQHFTTLTEEFTKKLEDLNRRTETQASLESQLATLREQQKVTWEDANSVITKYGLDPAGLGQPIRQGKTTADATDLLNDMQTLFDFGADVGGVLSQLSGQISGLVNESLRFGTEIPSNMKPYIEELFRSGQLLDANGGKIKDISGLKWGDPVKTEAEKIATAIGDLVLKLDELIESLKRDFPNAMRTGVGDAQGILDRTEWRVPDIDINANIDDGGDSRYQHGGPVYAARGGHMRGTDSVPAWLTPGEFVLNRETVRRVGVGALQAINRGGGAGSAGVIVQIDARDAVFDGVSINRLADKVGAAIMQRGAMRGLRFSGVGA